jgi:aspartokinase-like uncharacterized kinase
VVVKVGGSLYDLPDLGRRLSQWLVALGRREVLLLPGGGPTADVVRDFDHWHRLGEEAAHWLALQALGLNACFLATLLAPHVRPVVVGWPSICPPLWQDGQLPILDGHAFAAADVGRPGCLPHCWSVTSDSLAARVAIVAGADRLILLKSITPPAGIDWAEAGRRGFVDAYFAEAIRGPDGGGTCLAVQLVNLRAWPVPGSADRPGSVP